MSALAFLKPILTALVLPPASLIALLMLGLWLGTRRRRLGRFLVGLSLASLWMLSTPVAATWIQSRLLQPPAPLTANELNRLKQGWQGEPAMIVILGGGLRPWSPEHEGPRLNETSMARLQFGLHLARQTGLPAGFSGGVGWAQQGADGPSIPAEADVAAIAAQDEFQHPLAFKESQSRDTAENARRSSEALAALGILHVVVVTHAWHMPRAMRHFRQAFGPKVDVIAAPMGPFSSSDDGRLLRWLPSAEGMRNCWRGLREWLGLLLT